jgi:hypothetical protein
MQLSIGVLSVIYELKQYTPHPGKAEGLKARFVSATMPIFARLDIQLVAVFEPQSAADELWYIVAFENAAKREAAWARFAADEEWKRIKTESECEGPLLASQRTHLMQALGSVQHLLLQS